MSSPSPLGMHGLLPSQPGQLGSVPNSTSNSYNDLGKIQGINSPGNPQMNLLQGLPGTLDLEQFQQTKLVQDPKKHLPAGLYGSGLAAGPATGSFPNISNWMFSAPFQEHDDIAFFDMDMGCEIYPLGTCI
ncbi:hypothetical protein BHE74_00031328 [Ensete ventricosum]|uniref:Uncharacterized protein n=1 Tax=Ensete ventricosum TaxID=4639 RepID=A0A426Z6L3_ENSVE|nr:hypothetical protein B296_00011357 [Ensete ventricosum]RWV82825.1 hypothetical protein GW17_00055640 [Ensete ventricosum]RWW61607.1 hypothetical protein BHE74_00031328 [Ensete ventricosum]RZS08644.1 hypothetical protein BHM03_00039647 [Ensete ventricosum]